MADWDTTPQCRYIYNSMDLYERIYTNESLLNTFRHDKFSNDIIAYSKIIYRTNPYDRFNRWVDGLIYINYDDTYYHFILSQKKYIEYYNSFKVETFRPQLNTFYTGRVNGCVISDDHPGWLSFPKDE